LFFSSFSSDNLSTNSVVADIGSGTGIFTKLLLDAGYKVFGVEPNESMRKYSETIFANNPCFVAIDSRAENINLPDCSIDLLTAAQAFHWFDTGKALNEFYRVLKPNGIIVLVWNERKNIDNPFMKGYEKLLVQYCHDYSATNHKNFSFKNIIEIFINHQIERYRFDNFQNMNLDALTGRLKSCSYCLKPDQKNYSSLFSGLNELFSSNHNEGNVRFEYDTFMYVIRNNHYSTK